MEIHTPAGNGTFRRMFKAIAIPITSATSVAMIAHSAKNQRIKFNQRGKYSRHALDKSNPVTDPNLIQSDCKNMAIMLDNNTMKRSEYL
ncbi:hypothetical protein WICPIJ_000170 [Wickerhamomyces pijperi]|uniref:Uncharacterized protein n=1 Tax=Wickerhamomyces pijperi TaxID=599730 RepID=A0A9P8TSE0_WICPI|nr:hypothetical protein WICPIJ_000170 [Wickerhamomyces pijperi]